MIWSNFRTLAVVLQLLGCGQKSNSSTKGGDGYPVKFQGLTSIVAETRIDDAQTREADTSSNEAMLIEILFQEQYLDDTVGVSGDFVVLESAQPAPNDRLFREGHFHVREVFWGQLVSSELEVVEFTSNVKGFRNLTDVASVAAVLSRCQIADNPALKVVIAIPLNEALGQRILARGREIQASAGLGKGDASRECEPAEWPQDF